MSQETIESLLVEWEVCRQEGRTVPLSELCCDHPELLDEVSGRIENLKSTAWMLEDASDTGTHDDPETAAGSETPAENGVTAAEFFDTVVDSGVLPADEVDRLRSDYIPTDVLAWEFTAQLIRDGVLTDYQADVLLKRKDGPLLLDRYIILDTIGSGGMGVVFKALHRSMERIVALKVLPQYAVDSPDKIACFQREIKAAAKLSHPNIVAAYDAHQGHGTHFLVMEYVAGSDLWRQVREEGPFGIDDAVRIVL